MTKLKIYLIVFLSLVFSLSLVYATPYSDCEIYGNCLEKNINTTIINNINNSYTNITYTNITEYANFTNVAFTNQSVDWRANNVTANWFYGLFNWLIDLASQPFLSFNGSTLSLNSSAFCLSNGTGCSSSVNATAGGSNTQVQFNDNGKFNGSSNLVYNKTNAFLGLGSSDQPSYRFDLRTHYATWAARLWDAGDGILLFGYDVSGVPQIQAYLDTDPSSLLLNPLGGNVGIGTTTPTSKLQVNGNITSDNIYARNICYSNGTGCQLFNMNYTNIPLTNQSNNFQGNSFTNVSNITYTNSTFGIFQTGKCIVIGNSKYASSSYGC